MSDPRLGTWWRRREAMSLALAALMLTPLLLAACNLQRKGGPTARATPSTRAWPFAPDQIRIHPLTRYVENPVTSDVSIDFHLELLDSSGDAVKGLGQLLIELYRELGPVSGVGDARQIKRWTLDLSNLDENAQAYDRVTRTYRLTLTGLPAVSGSDEQLQLRAQLTTPDGLRLSTLHRLGG